MAWDDNPPPKSWDSEPPDSSGSYWDDVGNNTLEGIKEGIKNAPDSAKSMFPMVSAITKPLSGEIPNLSDIKDTYEGLKKTVPAFGQGVWQGVKDTGKVGLMPLEMASGTPASQTMAGSAFRQKPISTTLGVAGTVAPLFAAGRATFATKGPNMLERVGARGMLNDAGIEPATIGKLTKPGMNPVNVGEDLGGNLAEKGIVGGSGKSNFDNFMKAKTQSGQAVKQALQDIKKANSGLGVYPELEDSLKVDSVPTLKPIIDEANQLAKSGYDRTAARSMKRMYDNLQTKSNENGGFLTLDHVDEELNHVGKLFGNAGRGTDKWNMAAKLYGKLANIRDSMVSDIAEKTGNADLKNNLLKANAEYSKHMRIEPDIRSAANVEAVTGPGRFLEHPWENAVKFGSKGVYKTGRAARRIFEPMKGGVGNEKGSIFPASNAEQDLPVMQPGSKTGDPHALFSYNDNFGPGGTERSNYTVFGDPNHPVFKNRSSTGSGGHGSTMAEDDLNDLGIPIVGREPRSVGKWNPIKSNKRR